jgi:hypothetical protein
MGKICDPDLGGGDKRHIHQYFSFIVAVSFLTITQLIILT